jgi:hypothetical protein
LENSTGLYITETIEALETISAHNAAGTRPAMGVPHRPPRPAHLDEKVQRRLSFALNSFFLDNKLSQNVW